MAAQDALYDTLRSTAESWVLATLPKTPGTNEVDYDRILSLLTSDAEISWGHSLFVSQTPPLRGTKTPDGFLEHMKSMAPRLGTWQIAIADICVDTAKRSAVVRADFDMQAEVDGEVVRNEILFWVKLDESGKKVKASTEFVDPIASGKLRELMMAKAAKAGGGAGKAV
nr:hypothetical protein B0A51_10552 [Rachicladosporium sp. CCFEE 5018]